jgi:hypothetical protein
VKRVLGHHSILLQCCFTFSGHYYRFKINQISLLAAGLFQCCFSDLGTFLSLNVQEVE